MIEYRADGSIYLEDEKDSSRNLLVSKKLTEAQKQTAVADFIAQGDLGPASTLTPMEELIAKVDALYTAKEAEGALPEK